MASGYRRRDFIRNVSLYGLSLELVPRLAFPGDEPGSRTASISNDYFTAEFNESTGRFTIRGSNGNLIVDKATARMNLAAGRRSLSDKNYVYAADVLKIKDAFGEGRKLSVYARDRDKLMDIVLSIKLYNSLNPVFINISCKNVSGREINIRSLEPLCAIPEIGASMEWMAAGKILTNGPMYYDPGMIISPSENYSEPSPYGPIKGGSLSPDFEYPSPRRIRSWWNAALFSGYDREGLVCGFIDNRTGLGQMILSETGAGSFSLYTESVFAPGTILMPGKEISSGDFIICISGDPYTALEQYARIMGSLNSARPGNPVNGWCSWFYTYQFVDEGEVIRNAEFVSANLKKYGIRYIQVDEGYQRYHGEWEGNERFPHGMKWLADKIREYGLLPGIWLAPYVISEPANVFKEHPEWLLKKPDGTPMRVGPWPDENSNWAKNEDPRRYGLDITHPGAQNWLFDLFDTAANKWGYEMFKIDFVAWSLLSAGSYYDRSYTPAMAYRKGMEIIRKAAGWNRHINDCGPGPVSAGLIDSMRIESDQNYGFSEAAWRQYFTESASSAPAAAKRYYFNRKTWVNDADHICLAMLDYDQARAAATLIGLTGGNQISGDRLTNLDAGRLEILKKVFPSGTVESRPVDLFDSDRHSIFAVNLKNESDQWTVAGFFNPGLKEILKGSLPLKRLWLNPDRNYISYDFWREKLHGEFTGTIEASVMPGSVTLLSIHEKTGRPQVISTDRHILQGVHETAWSRWDETSKTLEVKSLGFPHGEYNVIVYIPSGIEWRQDNSLTYRDFEGYSVRPAGTSILKVHLQFGEADFLIWKISF